MNLNGCRFLLALSSTSSYKRWGTGVNIILLQSLPDGNISKCFIRKKVNILFKHMQLFYNYLSALLTPIVFYFILYCTPIKIEQFTWGMVSNNK